MGGVIEPRPLSVSSVGGDFTFRSWHKFVSRVALRLQSSHKHVTRVSFSKELLVFVRARKSEGPPSAAVRADIRLTGSLLCATALRAGSQSVWLICAARQVPKTLYALNNPFSKITRPFDAPRSKQLMVAEAPSRRLAPRARLRPAAQDQAKLISELQEEPRKPHDSAYLLDARYVSTRLSFSTVALQSVNWLGAVVWSSEGELAYWSRLSRKTMRLSISKLKAILDTQSGWLVSPAAAPRLAETQQIWEKPRKGHSKLLKCTVKPRAEVPCMSKCKSALAHEGPSFLSRPHCLLRGIMDISRQSTY